MAHLQAGPTASAASWEIGMIEAGAIAIAPASAPESLSAPAEPAASFSLRCRFGLHRWLPLALSFGGAGRQPCISFCRDCPAIRRPTAH